MEIKRPGHRKVCVERRWTNYTSTTTTPRSILNDRTEGWAIKSQLGTVWHFVVVCWGRRLMKYVASMPEIRSKIGSRQLAFPFVQLVEMIEKTNYCSRSRVILLFLLLLTQIILLQSQENYSNPTYSTNSLSWRWPHYRPIQGRLSWEDTHTRIWLGYKMVQIPDLSAVVLAIVQLPNLPAIVQCMLVWGRKVH